ncbi:MAG: RusA family crossover junction endodeoxyribonuclease, partial [bacterium]
MGYLGDNWRPLLDVTVHGDPAPQGSKRAFRNQHSGKIQQKESSTRLDPWRQDVRHAVELARPDGPPTIRAVRVSIQFAYARPKSHYRTGANAHLLREQAPPAPMNRANDIDKLVRAVLDAITSTSVVWHDDGQVVAVGATKA